MTFELIGTLSGKAAEKAARLTVHQEYYRNRSKLQQKLIEELKTEYPDFSISPEKLKKIDVQIQSKVPNPVTTVLVSLEDWMIICIYSIGVDETRRVIAHAIDKAYNHAKELIYDTETKLSQQTKSICIDELLSKIEVLRNKQESTKELESEDQVFIAKTNGVELEEIIDISFPLREKIHEACLQACIDAATDHAKSKFDLPFPEPNSVAQAGANIVPGTEQDTLRIRFSMRCQGTGVDKLRSQIQNGVQITQFLGGSHDPFENIPEQQIFRHCSRVITRILTVPKAKHIWVGLTDQEFKTKEDSLFEVSGASTFCGFSSTTICAMEMEESVWDCLPLTEGQLVAFLLGMSEYLCDDFGIKSIHRGDSMIFYPTDTPLKLGWLPTETVLHCKGYKGHHKIPLSPQMVNEVKLMCDFLIENVSDLILLSPPMPRYLLQQVEVKNRKNKVARNLFFTSVVLLLGLWYGLTRGHWIKENWKQKLNEVQMQIKQITIEKR
eukprot:g2440.t1